jgi:four helix bundle protein
MKLTELKVYNEAMLMGEKIWAIVEKWNYFQKDTVGKQLVRAADSIAANLSEGFGRYHYKESKNFGYYSRGSLFETVTWLTKAHSRKLLETEVFNGFTKDLEILGKILNGYIKSIGKDSKLDRDNNTDSQNEDLKRMMTQLLIIHE